MSNERQDMKGRRMPEFGTTRGWRFLTEAQTQTDSEDMQTLFRGAWGDGYDAAISSLRDMANACDDDLIKTLIEVVATELKEIKP